jgi:hypothetical protein
MGSVMERAQRINIFATEITEYTEKGKKYPGKF